MSSRVRWRLFAMFSSGLITLILAISLGFRLYGEHRLETDRTSFERRDLSLDLTSYELPEPPMRENAAQWLQAGASAIVLPRDAESRIQRLLAVDGKDWTVELTEQVREVLKDNEGALLTLRHAAPLDRSSFGIHYSEGFEARMPALSPMRKAILLLRADTRLALRSQDRDRALIALQTLSRFSDALGAEPLLIMQRMAGFAEGEYLKLVSDVATSEESAITDQQSLRRLLASMPEQDRVQMMRRSLAYEAAAWSERGDDFVPHFIFGADLSHPAQKAIGFSFTKLTQAVVVESFLREIDAIDQGLPGENSSRRPGPSWLFRIPPWTIASRVAPFQNAGVHEREAMAQRERVRAALELRAGSAQARRPAAGIAPLS